jgi:hypothetical protein
VSARLGLGLLIDLAAKERRLVLQVGDGLLEQLAR